MKDNRLTPFSEWLPRLVASVGPYPGTQVAVVGEFRAAAVLALFDAQGQVVLTQRPSHMPSHAGQIAFPGGKIEARDNGPIAAALREAREEIGLVRLPEQLALLPILHTATRFAIYPVVGCVPRFPVWRPNPAEVTEIFTLPAHLTLNPSAYRPRYLARADGRFESIELDCPPRDVWGATASILYALALAARSLGLAPSKDAFQAA